MKSYITRKFPLATRTTDHSFDERSEAISCFAHEALMNEAQNTPGVQLVPMGRSEDWVYRVPNRGNSFTALSRSTARSSVWLNIPISASVLTTSTLLAPGGKSVPNSTCVGGTSCRSEA